MTNHCCGYGASLSNRSQTSKDSSFEHNSQNLTTLSQGTRHLVGGNTATPFVAHAIKPSPCLDQRNVVHGGGHSGGGTKRSNKGNGSKYPNMRKKLKQPMKPKGRPPGSKNKPKIDDEALRHAIIEISVGCDVVKELIKFAEIHDVGLTVLSGSGAVTNVPLSPTFSQPLSSLMTLHGTFTMLSLSGTQGQIFGGVVAGRIIAVSLVVVVAALYKKPVFHKVLNNETNSSLVDFSDVDPLKGDNASFMALLASFNDANSSPTPVGELM